MADVLSMMDQALRVVDGFSELKQYADLRSLSDSHDNVLLEIEILQAIFSESILLLRECDRTPPRSAEVTITRCQKLEKELLVILKSLRRDTDEPLRSSPSPRQSTVSDRAALRRKQEQSLIEIGKAFKSCVMLLRSIAIEYEILLSSQR